MRLTLFTSALLPASETLWTTLTGQTPETDQYQPRELVRLQFGVLGDFAVTAQVTAVRTDILLGPPPLAVPGITFAPLSNAVDQLTALVGPWLDKLDAEILRIAFGAVLLHPATDRTEAYDILGRYVPSVKVDPAASRELFYRINRPKTNSEGLELNRITSWSSIVIRTAMVSGGTTAEVAGREFARLELDHSTPAIVAHPLEKRRLLPTFQELVALGVENAVQGEIPK